MPATILVRIEKPDDASISKLGCDHLRHALVDLADQYGLAASVEIRWVVELDPPRCRHCGCADDDCRQCVE